MGGSITTFRSALGISEDGLTLYYAAGPDLTLPALTRALKAAGAYQAIQLDINEWWVHFDAIQSLTNRLHAVPLFDSMKGQSDQRYLTGFLRDVFYITAVKNPTAGN